MHFAVEARGKVNGDEFRHTPGAGWHSQERQSTSVCPFRTGRVLRRDLPTAGIMGSEPRLA